MNVYCKYDELVDVRLLKPHPKNRNKHPKEQIDRLAKILKYQGLRAPIVVSKKTGFIVKGHGTLLAIKENKWKEAPIVTQDFEDTDQEYAFVQSDNAIASWAELDLAWINVDLGDLGPFDIDLLGIKDFVVEPSDKYGDKDADDIPTTRSTNIVRGDCFTLGSHRLMCGDSTDKEDVARLMNGEKVDMVFTDPPYGIGLRTNYSATMGVHKNKPNNSKNHRPIIGDEKEFNPNHLLGLCDEIFLFGANFYCWNLPRGGSWVCWDKKSKGEDNIGLIDGSFASDFELCWSKKKHGTKIFRVLNSKGFYEANTDETKVHPSQKPVSLIGMFFGKWGKDALNIVDLYGGSGSTLIACEKMGKKCFMSEIDPQYCQVIIDRWEKFTGNKAVKLG